MDDLFNRRLLITMGKGGVGKSLISAALTRLALKRNKRVLLVQINTKDKISAYLGCKKTDSEVKEIMPNLFSVNIEPGAALKEYALMQIRIELIYKLVFQNRAVKYFLNAVPALNDLVILGKIYYHVQQKDKSGKNLYDIVIVDAPPTGHGLFLINLPRVMLRVVHSGPIFKEANSMLEMLRDPKTTAINLVTLPEEMPVAEIHEMYESILNESKMPFGFSFINAVFPDLFLTGDKECIKQAEKLENADINYASGLAAIAISRRTMSEHYRKKLKELVPVPTVSIPYIFDNDFKPDTLEKIAQIIEEGMSRHYES